MTELMVGNMWLEIYQTTLGVIFMLCSFLSSLPSLFTPSPLKGPLSPLTEAACHLQKESESELFTKVEGSIPPPRGIFGNWHPVVTGIGSKPDTSWNSSFFGWPHPQLWVKDVPPRPARVGGGLEVTSLHATDWAISPIPGFSHWAAPNQSRFWETQSTTWAHSIYRRKELRCRK